MTSGPGPQWSRLLPTASWAQTRICRAGGSMPGPGPRGRWAPPWGRGWGAACLPRRSESGPAHSRQRPQGQEQARRNDISPPRTALTMSPKPQGCCFWRARRQASPRCREGGLSPGPLTEAAPVQRLLRSLQLHPPAVDSGAGRLGSNPSTTAYSSRDPGHTTSAHHALLNVPVCKMGK